MAKNKGGRPSDYTPEKGDEICALIIQGNSLNKICKADDMPHIMTVMRWVRNYEEFRLNYTRARAEQADTFFDEMIDIADDGTNDSYVDEDGNKRTDQDVIQRSRLRIDTRKWVLGKMKPKKYGEKVEVEHSGEVTNRNIEIVTKSDVDDDDIGFVDS